MLELYLVSDRSWLNDRPLEEDIEQAILGGVTTVSYTHLDVYKRQI